MIQVPLRRLAASLMPLIASILLGIGTAHAQPSSSLPPHHIIDIIVTPGQRTIDVRDQIEIPTAQFQKGRATVELADFIRPRFRLVRGAARLRTSSVAGDFGTLWHLDAQPLPGSRSVEVEVSYRIQQPKSAQLAVGTKSAFAGSSGDAWYPQLHYQQPEIGELRFTVPPGHTVIATGSLIDAESNPAAGKFHYRVTRPLKFAFASGPYRKIETPGGKFSLYSLRERPELTELAGNVGKQLSFLERLFGQFPYGFPALVEVDFPSIVLGASEAGMILADESQLTEQSVLYWTHEFAHQWWGNFVKARPRSAAASMFTEGLSEFSALLAFEETSGRAALRNLRLGCVGDSPIARYGRIADSNRDRPLRKWTPSKSNEVVVMHRLATSKASHVLAMLADELGLDAVTNGLRGIIASSGGAHSSWAELEAQVSKSTGRDLSEFFMQWLDRPGIADLVLDWREQGDGVVGTVTQRGTVRNVRVPIELIGADEQRVTETLRVTAERTEFRFAPGYQVRNVQLDPNYRLLRKPLPSDLRGCAID